MKKSNFQECVERLQRNYQKKLMEAALEYLRAGMDFFHRHRRQVDYINPQAALGNLAISVELMLKAFIASKNLTLLFKGLPLETRVLLTCPASLPDNFRWTPLDVEIRSAKHRTIGLSECITIFFIFLPKFKQSLQSHLKSLAGFRNTSVHSVLPSFQKYELERAAYVAQQILEILQDEEVVPYRYAYTKGDKQFLAAFQEERLERVRKQVETAKECAKKLSGKEDFSAFTDIDWENFVTRCPVCGNEAQVIGYTELRSSHDGGENLDFWPYSFVCDACGLALNDSEELKLAGVPSHIDRSSELDEYSEMLYEESLHEAMLMDELDRIW